jgi:hypothetical protein
VNNDRDPALREAARGVGIGGVALLCVALIAAITIAGYVLVTAFFQGLH